jgi:hypothetical protein
MTMSIRRRPPPQSRSQSQPPPLDPAPGPPLLPAAVVQAAVHLAEITRLFKDLQRCTPQQRHDEAYRTLIATIRREALEFRRLTGDALRVIE